MIGINISGAEFGSGGVHNSQYHYPTFDELKFYKDKGVDVVRLPFTWERMQSSLGGPLNSNELALLKGVLANAATLGMDVIVDLHNYGRFNGQPFGSATGPTSAQFADFWVKLSAEIKGYTSLLGYDLMNEPHNMPSANAWKDAAQTAVNAIRKIDMNNTIYVEGNNWSGAWSWQWSNKDFIINDPANKLVYQAHQYFDRDSSGIYRGTYDEEGAYAMIGVDRLKPFVEWLKANNFKGMIGEVGVPSDDPRWLEVMKNSLDYMKANGLLVTAWGGGTWWPTEYDMYMGAPGRADSAYLDLLEGHFEQYSDAAFWGATTTTTPPPPPSPPPPTTTTGTVDGTAGADLLRGTSANDMIFGRDGNDTILGSAGSDTIDGGTGLDVVDYTSAGGSVNVDLNRADQIGSDAASDRLTNIENITGSGFDDQLRGNGAANVINGGAGNDTLRGEAGNDLLEGRAGADTLVGGEGVDTASYADSTAGVDINLYRGTQLGGHAAGDTLQGVENFVGSRLNDRFLGDGGANRIEAGDGDDWLDGNWGADTLTGGNGRDRFYFDSATNANGDRVTDFSINDDRLDFSQIDANVHAGGNQAFSWIGTGGFTRVAGQMRSYVENGQTFVAGDMNGDGVADFSVVLTGTYSLNSSHILL